MANTQVHTAESTVHDATGRVHVVAGSRFVCQSRPTGHDGGPCVMVAASHDSVFVSPARSNQKMGTDLLRTRDAGQTFQVVDLPRPHRAAPPDYRLQIVSLLPSYFRRLSRRMPNGVTFHPFLFRDPASGRLFASTTLKGAYPDGSGAVLAFSDDDGASWVESRVGQGSWDWGKLFAGPAASDESRRALARSGYPHVLYYTGTGPTLISGPNQLCYRSLDGGRSWERRGNVFTLMEARTMQTGFAQVGVVQRDGSIHLAVAGTPLNFIPYVGSQDIRVRMLQSRDEGETWEQQELADTRTSMLAPTLAVDGEDTLFSAWNDHRSGAIALVWSHDGGARWSAPLLVTPPGLRYVSKVAIAARGRGELALSYWGSAEREASGDGWVVPDGRPYNGYMTWCSDVLARAPLFHTACINDPVRPLLPHGESALTTGEYIGAPAFADDGAIWGAFLSRTHPRGSVIAVLRRCAAERP